MTILKKLVVKGIRSYNPKKEQSIDFQLPLTLIVGQNGTGKTTLIECLKYITTGTLPPNAKGGAFIYDGGLANNTEVKAEIKLHLHDFHDREIIIQKIIQTSIKQTRTEQKVLEFNVWVNNNKEEILDFNNTIRPSCGKINKDDLTSVFEINTSILENVIFCHQDDAMWYLAEPATIKKKFDDIFSSTRYSKILENLKKAKKDIITKIKVLHTELSYLLKVRDKKYEIETRYKETEEELESKTCNIAGLEKNLKDCLEILKNLNSEHAKITVVVNKKKEIANFKNLKEVKYSETECKHLLETINLEFKENEIVNLENKIEKEEKEIKIIEENKEKYEKIQIEMENIKNKKSLVKTSIEEINENINFLEKWLIDQKQKFQLKLKIENPITNSDDYNKIFELFFEKYNQELNRKNKIVSELKTQFDKLNWEMENNKKKILDLEHLSDFQYNENDYFEIEDIESKIRNLEFEYEKAVKLTREMVVNEEKRKRRDNLLFQLQNKTKTCELENIKINTENIRKIKLEIKKINDLSNKLNFNKTIIKSKYAKFNNRIYENGDFVDNEASDLVFLGKEITTKLLNLSLKNQKCYLCEKEIDDCENYKNKLNKLGNDKIDANNRINEANFQICNEIKEIIKNYNSGISEAYKITINDNQKVSEFSESYNFVMSSISKILMKLEKEINEKEMLVIDLDEENVAMKNNIKMFNEIENMNIKNINCASIDEIQNDLKKYKLCKQIKDKKEKIGNLTGLIEQNKALEKNIEKIKNEMKIKKDKNDVLKNNINKKKAEVDVKLNDFYSKKDKFAVLNADFNKLEQDFERLSENTGNYNFKNLTILIEKNLKNKNLLISLKNDLTITKQQLVSVKEHLEYYKSINKYKRIENEIKVLEENLKNKLKLKDNIITDYLDTLSIKIQNIKNKHSGILEKKNMLKGEINQLRTQLKNFENELNTEYKDVVNNYNEKYVESKILELSNNDIDRCISVLDKSIIDYHYNKIEEINLTLKELWGNCYKGNDIDCIRLKINENGTKNYSYKMMIVKNNIELDMRNRSSAGQKMIGNILLRMALSKVFCCNFNVLTLDEPTTNLDKENIESLAYTLVNITKTNPNLQLVIITHDEDFLSIMCRENLEYFYRLTRNSNGDSVILKEKA